MADQATFLMCSPRGDESASYSLGSYVTSLLEEKGFNINEYHIYTLQVDEFVPNQIDQISLRQDSKSIHIFLFK